MSVRAVEPRLPEPGVCTAETLARLPARTVEVTIQMGCHTIAPVHKRPHYVKSIRVASASAVTLVPPARASLPRKRARKRQPVS